MATKLIVVFAAGVFVAGLVHSLRPGRDDARERALRTEPEAGAERRGDPAREPRLLGPRARELAVAPGIWSAWKPYPPLARESTTVLWRTEGTVSRLSLAGQRRSARLVVRFGPSPVLPTLAGAGLRWERPGREWGSRLVFPTAGIWTVRVSAGRRAGAVRVRVVEPRPARSR